MDNLDKIADEAVKSQPVVNQDSIDALSDTASRLDTRGTAYDPERHLDGFRADGTWRKKRQRRSASLDSTLSVPDVPYSADALAAAITATETLFIVAQGALGEEWKPVMKPVDERQTLTQAFAVYFESKDIHDFPPGVVLSIALLMYGLPRLTKPTMQQKLSGTWAWIKVHIFRRNRHVTQSHLRTNGIRENDNGERSSVEVPGAGN